MAAFPLLPGAWTKIVSAGGLKDQQIQVISGRVLINIGAPDASSSPQVASTLENKLVFAPSGLEVYARAMGPAAAVTTADLSTSTGGGAATAKAVDATAAGPVYTVPRLLGSSSTLALITGTNANLTINATTGVITAASAIAVGASQTAVVSETNGSLRMDYPVVVTGISSGVTPTPTPTLLPTLANQYAAYGAKRIVSGYNGRLFTLRRASDGALRDVSAATGSDLPDYAAIVTWAGASKVNVQTLYDQWGTGPVATWTDATNMPSFDTTQALAGAVPFLFDSIGGIGVSKFLRADVVLERSALTIFDVLQPLSSEENSTQWALYNSGLKATLRTDRAVAGLRFTGDTNGHNFGTGAIPRANPSVIGLSASLTSTKLYIREQEIVGTGTEAQAINLLAVGGDQGSNVTNASAARWGFVIYSAQLSSADALSVRDALTGAFSIPTSFNARIVFAGDSITLGSGSTLLLNRIRQLSLTSKAELFNTGIGGQVVTTMNTRYAAFISPLYTTAYGAGRCVLEQQGGTNDLQAGATAATLQGRITTYVNSAKADGFKIGLGTIIPRVESGLPANFDTERMSYNAWVIANSLPVDFTVDYAGESHFAAAGATTTASGLYGDEANGTAGAFIHPSTLGYSYLAPLDSAKLNALLA